MSLETNNRVSNNFLKIDLIEFYYSYTPLVKDSYNS